MGEFIPFGKNAGRLKTTHVHIFIVIACAVIIYWPVCRFNFLIGWDDQWFVTNHYTKNGVTLRNLSSVFTDFYCGQYAPINQLFYTCIYSLVGYKPNYFHTACLVIHLANSVLVYDLIRKVSGDISNLPPEQNLRIAFVTALLFAVMPVNVEPVAWVSASKVTLYAFFYLLALGWYRRYVLEPKQKYFYLSLVFYIVSFGAKEQAVVLPLSMLLMDYVYGRNLLDRLIWFEKLPIFILSVLFGGVTIASQRSEGGDFYSIFQRLPLSFYTLSEYFTKVIAPVNLSYLYPFPFQKTATVPLWLWIYPLAIPAVVYCFFKQFTQKCILFGLLFFMIHIILVCNILSLSRYSVTADRYAYLSSIGLCFVVGYIFVLRLSRTRYKSFLIAIGVTYVVVLIVYANSYVKVWSSTYILKEKLKTTIEQRGDFKQLNKK
ncbi:hypothetical protein [Mucilaginibacter gynuensis]|uniref:hypothetical protein n=1 Tax=Mucilaginibacter gynuensis TaxID=1302236 RepID=UPI0031EA4587